jgi:hypothetical protein
LVGDDHEDDKKQAPWRTKDRARRKVLVRHTAAAEKLKMMSRLSKDTSGECFESDSVEVFGSL